MTKGNACWIVGVALCISGQMPIAAEPVLPMCMGAPGMTEEIAAEQSRILERGVLALDRAVEHAYQALPFDQIQLEAVRHVLGDEPIAIFNWVRDETRWLPYAGALRGAEGVLLDRSGSSLDRSLLLAALLEEAGHVARLVRADLDDSARTTLQTSWSQTSMVQHVAPHVPEQQELESIAALQDVPVRELQQVYENQSQIFEQARERVQSQARRQVDALLALRDSVYAHDEQPSSNESVPLSSHWWVQWQVPDGWRDLDPATPQQRFGERLLSVPDDAFDFYFPEDLPERHQHWLTIRIVAEQWAQGKLHEHVALEHRVATAALIGQQIKIDTPPLNMPDIQALIDGGLARENLHRTLMDESQWMPYLRVGNDVIRQKLINDDGSVEDPVDGVISSAFSQAMDSAISALDALSFDGRPGGSMAAGEPGDQEADPELTAVMLRLYVDAPERQTDIIERPLMDTLGPGLRSADVNGLQISESQREQRAVALMGSFELLPQISWLPPEQLAAWRYREILQNRQGLLGAAYSLTYNDLSFAADILAANTGRRAELDSLAALRLAFSPYLENIALTRLNLLAYVNLVEYQAEDLLLRHGFDILDNRVDVIGAADVATIRVAQGVLETILEAELLEAFDDADDLTGANTARAFGQDLDAGHDWLWIDDADQLSQISPAPDADMLAHYQQVLANGLVLIMPTSQSDIGQTSWWRLDPATGDMLGFGPDRRGQILEAVLRLFSAIDNASGAVEMVATIWGCMGEFASGVADPNITPVDPQCCIAKAAGAAMVGTVAGMSILSVAKGTWKIGISYSPVGSLGVLQAGVEFHSGRLGGELGERFFSKMECQ